ncbi:hypothetical protein BM536_008260 [Streptomyces phaeoluteigriseus]|uniref:Uncharacterized protein n=1 Tax=Streptomyces phaeoluteigriseus TaxID=114686 RepID=A0A1V6MVH2_9ACTN|nr:hypothetical protein BM536_008260 [Streptomyces phaeoluteigriseus]
MDYCSTCRRHLNGALVCPGCGAYAPDIAPPATNSRPVPIPGATAATTADAPGSWQAGQSTSLEPGYDSSSQGEAEPCDTGPAAADTAAAGSAGLGRAARRRQLARWNKNKRRAAVATAVAIVGGGLTVATMDRQSTDRTQAATAPDRHSMGLAEEQVVPESNRPAPAPPAEDRTSRTAADARNTGTARQQPQAVPASAEARSARQAPAGPPNARPVAAVPAPVAAPQPAAQTTDHAPVASAPENSGTAVQPSGSPAQADSTEASASQADPASASTSPSQLCLLVLCLD